MYPRPGTDRLLLIQTSLAARQMGDHHPVTKGKVDWNLTYVGDSDRDQRIIRDYLRGLMALWRRDMDSRSMKEKRSVSVAIENLTRLPCGVACFGLLGCSVLDN